MTPSACPERGALQAMVRGDMSDDLFERLVRHLEECPSCQAALDELSQADATWTLCRRVWRDLAPPGYTLRELIGRGGMGLVFRAWDVRLEREVAIKCIQERFAHSPTARERFFSEAKITGRLQHPGIPAVHELGTLPDGRPYLAMKLVHGQTLSQIIRSASRHRLLAILEQVCHAVGYAHAHRVIHRDLKPSNIMVGAHGEVQVMDWGLAKVLACASSVSAESTVRDADDPSTASALDKTPDPFTEGTATGEVVGTPAYMPPEQAAGQVHRVDPRSDVFALGAILCEILTGYPPYTGADISAVRRQAVHADLTQALRRLDAVEDEPELVQLCKRCLSPEPKCRPGDARAVADELVRIRTAAEERARQAELERARMLVQAAEERRRRRLWLAAAGIVAAVLSVGILGTTWGLVQARKQQHIAQNNLHIVRVRNSLLMTIFDDLNLERDDVPTEPLNAVLGKRLVGVLQSLRAEAPEQEVEVAHMQYKLGKALLALGYHLEAADVLARSHRSLEQHLGPAHEDTLGCLAEWAQARRRSGQLDEALHLYREAHRKMVQAYGADAPEALTALDELANALVESGQIPEALALLEPAVPLFRARFGDEHPETLAALNNLAFVYRYAGRLAEAAALYQEVLERREKTIGPTHYNTLSTRNNLAVAYRAMGRLSDALQLLQTNLAAYRKTLGDEHPETVAAMNNLASVYLDLGQPERARSLFEEALQCHLKRYGPDHPDTLVAYNNLGAVFHQSGRPAEALPYFLRAVQGLERMQFRHERAIQFLRNISACYELLGRLSDSDHWRRKLLPILRERAGAESPVYASELAAMALSLLIQRKYSEAEPFARECLRIRQKHEPDSWTVYSSMSAVAGALIGQAAEEPVHAPDRTRKLAEAEPLLLNAVQGLEARRQSMPPLARFDRIVEAKARLVWLYELLDKPQEKARWQVELLREIVGRHPGWLLAWHRLAP